MAINREIMLYSLAKAFKNIDIPFCDNTKQYLVDNASLYSELDQEDKIYYTNYASKLATNLCNYLTNINFFEINNDDNESEIVHDFRLKWAKSSVSHISISHTTINVQNIIPEKLMKICKYAKNTNMSKDYLGEYYHLNDKFCEKIGDTERYSDLGQKFVDKNILNPFCLLVFNTLSKKRKCSTDLYNYLFNESNRLVLKLYKNRFIMYDFGTSTDAITSFKMKFKPPNELYIEFNNGATFNLVLSVNSSEIKDKISLKYHTTFTNLDDFFLVHRQTV